MESLKHYIPSGGDQAGTSTKLVHFPRISNDDQPPKPATSSTRFPQSLLNCFSFFHTKRAERPVVLKDPPAPEQKLPAKSSIKPVLPRQSFSIMESRIDASPYMWPHDYSFSPETTALVIIDMQKDCGYSSSLLY